METACEIYKRETDEIYSSILLTGICKCQENNENSILFFKLGIWGGWGDLLDYTKTYYLNPKIICS